MASGAPVISIDPEEEAATLARLFQRLATGVGEFRADHPELSDDDKSRLDLEAQQLTDRANLFNAKAIGATLTGLQSSLDNLQKVTVDAKEAVSRLQEFDKVVSIATAAVALATSISAGDIGAIGAALATLGMAVTTSQNELDSKKEEAAS